MTHLLEPTTPSSGPELSLEADESAVLPRAPQQIGRYVLFDRIASGGMGAVHLGRLLGSAGFERLVAVKRVHAGLARDPQLVAMFQEEIRLVARIRHPNVAAALDVVDDEGELLLVMEYVHGQTLAALNNLARQREQPLPLDICCAIACDALQGLHAAHSAESATGQPLNIVHRDVTPHNIIVGVDGSTRVLDFGVAKASDSRRLTQIGQIRGKLGYCAPEHVTGGATDRRADVYSLSVVLWEMLTGARLRGHGYDVETIRAITDGVIPPMASIARRPVPRGLEEIVRRGLRADREQRYQSAQEMALALRAEQPAPPQRVSEWLRNFAGPQLEERQLQMERAETAPISARGAASERRAVRSPSVQPPPGLGQEPTLVYRPGPPSPSPLPPSGERRPVEITRAFSRPLAPASAQLEPSARETMATDTDAHKLAAHRDAHETDGRDTQPDGLAAATAPRRHWRNLAYSVASGLALVGSGILFLRPTEPATPPAPAGAPTPARPAPAAPPLGTTVPVAPSSVVPSAPPQDATGDHDRAPREDRWELNQNGDAVAIPAVPAKKISTQPLGPPAKSSRSRLPPRPKSRRPADFAQNGF